MVKLIRNHAHLKRKMTVKKHYIYTPNLKKNYMTLVEGLGVYLFDEEGKKYLDSTAGPFISSIGHGRNDMAQVLYDQASKLEYAYRGYSINPPLINATEKLHQITGFERFMVVSGGTEANESAFKVVRQYHLEKGNPSKYKIISRHLSYHGSSMFTLSAAEHLGFRADYQPYIKEQAYIPPAYCYRCWFGQSPCNCKLPCAQALEDEILRQGPENVAAFFFETISGTSLACAYPQNNEYLKMIRRICDKYDILIIADEVLVGTGRTGKFNAFEHFDFKPDLFTLGKGIGGGYIPAAVVAVNKKVLDVIESGKAIMDIGFTMMNQAMQATAILKTLEIMEKENLVEAAREKDQYMRDNLTALQSKHPTLGAFNGLGLLWGLEFVKDKVSKEVLPEEWHFANSIAEAAKQYGLLTMAYGQVVNSRYANHPDMKRLLDSPGVANAVVGDKIMLTPPLIITKEEIDLIFERLDLAIGQVERDHGLI